MPAKATDTRPSLQNNKLFCKCMANILNNNKNLLNILQYQNIFILNALSTLRIQYKICCICQVTGKQQQPLETGYDRFASEACYNVYEQR